MAGIRAAGASAAGGLVVEGLSVVHGSTTVLDGVSFDVPAGMIVGLVGPNGAGKTTTLDALTGFVPTSAGTVTVNGIRLDGLPPHERARLGLARTFQSQELFEDLTVAENIAVAGSRDAVPAGFAAVAGALPADLSHDRRGLLAIERALARRPRVLLLDEPAAGLDGAARTDLATRLRAIAAGGTAVVLVDHDLNLVLELCDVVIVLAGGRLAARGTPAEIRDDPTVLAAYLGTKAAETPRPRSAPAASAPAASAPVLVVDKLSCGYAGVPVLRGVSMTVSAGEVVALVGPNGSGRTTLIRAVAGLLPPSRGRVTVLGAPSRVGPVRLARRGMALVPTGRALFTQLTVRQNLRLALPSRWRPGRAGVRDPDVALREALTLFPGLAPLLDRQTAMLSGGEQQQVALARALITRPRLFIVDELSFGLAPGLVPPLLAVLRETATRHGTGVLLVEQHVALALGAADRGYVLDRGRVTLTGPAAELAARDDLIAASYFGDAPAAGPATGMAPATDLVPGTGVVRPTGVVAERGRR